MLTVRTAIRREYPISDKEAQLLQDWLSPQQLTDLTSTGLFHVKGSAGGEYQLCIGGFHRQRKSWLGRKLGINEHCVQLAHGTQVDRLVGLKIMLENDELGVRTAADKW